MTTIRDVMSPDPISVEATCALADALERLLEYKISGLPVVDAANKIVGVLSERDLLRVYAEDDARVVGDLMTREAVSIGIDEPLVEVVDCIMSNDFRRVLIHENGKLAGVVSRADLMPAILDLLRERQEEKRHE